MAKIIGVGFDGSKSSQRALQEALRLAALEKVTLQVMTVEELPRHPASVDEVIEEKKTADDNTRALQEQARKLAAEQGVTIKATYMHGHPAKALVDFAAQAELDLLVLGHTGHSALWGSFLGTTADKVVRHASCSVLIVR